MLEREGWGSGRMGARGGKKEEDRGAYLEILTHEAIPNEVGLTRFRVAPALYQTANETHTGLLMPACHALAAVTLASGAESTNPPSWTFNLGWV